MKRLLKWLAILGVLVGIGVAITVPAVNYMEERRRITYREVEVTRGKIVAVVNSTGTVKPVRSVLVGSFVSGPVVEIMVDFNDEVKKDHLLARIDPRLYDANVERDWAALATSMAQVEKAVAQLQQAKNDEERAIKLRDKNKTFISATELDQIIFNRMVLEAQLRVAETTVRQAKASYDISDANLQYTEILSPVEGVIIDRKIDPGQTVAAAFQAPELFVVAPDMRKEIHVYASVDESEIGLIELARQTHELVRFTVDAYPDELFEGKVFQIRKNSTTTQNVVTYPVVVSSPNADLKLLPGMTASISFQVGKADKALRIPNAALRYYPQLKQVRPEDRKLLENKAATAGEADDRTEATRSAEEKSKLRQKRNSRHVWVVEGEYLRAVEVVTGLVDSNYTELVSGALREGDKLITGIQPKE
jgi:HlyD family secretion protein